ncbi:MAG: Mut7-C RNAse domain-containing protein [Candidatus Thermoplasmatota archaeon]|nr:Mut7-C RNAse domain-containing protein [Candidatus Thermoplasmatota archaeon]
MKFLCDSMLGNLAKWLRMMGYDVKYADDDEEDAEILQHAASSKRILLTRDKEIIGRRSDAQMLLVKSSDVDEQIKQVVFEFKLSPGKNAILSLCSECGEKLQPVDKGEVFGKVPDGVFARQDEFWQCPDCGKLYWKGSHYNKIVEKIESLLKP